MLTVCVFSTSFFILAFFLPDDYLKQILINNS